MEFNLLRLTEQTSGQFAASAFRTLNNDVKKPVRVLENTVTGKKAGTGLQDAKIKCLKRQAQRLNLQ